MGCDDHWTRVLFRRLLNGFLFKIQHFKRAFENTFIESRNNRHEDADDNVVVLSLLTTFKHSGAKI